MRRREFISFLGSAAALPFAARAQEAGRTYRLGGLHQSPRSAPTIVAFFAELQRAGFVEGQNLAVDANSYGLRSEQFADHAAELVKAHVDVIVAGGDAAIRAAQQATRTIPILANGTDLVSAGFVASLAKPGGNTTGFSVLAADLDGKRQEILIEAVPGISRMAALADVNFTSPRRLQMLQDEARTHGVELLINRAARPEEIVSAIDAAKSSGAAALNVLASATLWTNRQIIFSRVATLRLPAMYEWPSMAEEGGFVGYGANLTQLYRDIYARQCVKLLRGVKPADIPVEQPTKFELVINLKTANALGVMVPQTLLTRADEVIE
jgi:putative tryptophan/tyrosine transport system substrate-binding protein